MVLQDDGTLATARAASTIAIAIEAGALAVRKLTKAGRVKTTITPVARPATLWLATCCGQRVSMDQIGSIFGRE